MRYERRLLAWAVAVGAPGLATALALLWLGDTPRRFQVLGSLALLLASGLALRALHRRAIAPLRTLANMLAAVRAEDYSLRSRHADTADALGLVFHELNALMGDLRHRRLGALEATTLLHRVMAEAEIAVLAFDEDGVLRLANRTAGALFATEPEALTGRTAAALGLAECLAGETPRLLELPLATGARRFELRRGTFRDGGRPQHYLLLTDVSRALRAEEQLAWRRLIRVLTHEINNSLAPIHSLADRLRRLVGRPAAEGGASAEDLALGLGVIASRSAALSRFLGAYARLARLPAPRMGSVEVAEWVRRVAALETRLAVVIEGGPAVTLRADGDQLDQLLINLVANAIDAVAPTGGGVRIGWRVEGGRLLLHVDDDGPGVPASANLFVPFFTTKPGGAGIGLALSRQIAEAHGGTLALADRADGRGGRALCVLPLETPGRGAP